MGMKLRGKLLSSATHLFGTERVDAVLLCCQSDIGEPEVVYCHGIER